MAESPPASWDPAPVPWLMPGTWPPGPGLCHQRPLPFIFWEENILQKVSEALHIHRLWRRIQRQANTGIKLPSTCRRLQNEQARALPGTAASSTRTVGCA